jgi:DnaJ-domain-containing protein 1
MIKRLIDIARANLSHFGEKRAAEKTSADSIHEPDFEFDESESRRTYQPRQAEDPLAQYYANLEIAPGADREAVKSAWKRMMKKYHPDLHDTDPEKRKTADELTRRLTESYRILDKELSKHR